MIKKLIKISESRLLPDFLIRFGIRQLLKKRIASLVDKDIEKNHQKKWTLLRK